MTRLSCRAFLALMKEYARWKSTDKDRAIPLPDGFSEMTIRLHERFRTHCPHQKCDEADDCFLNESRSDQVKEFRDNTHIRNYLKRYLRGEAKKEGKQGDQYELLDRCDMCGPSFNGWAQNHHGEYVCANPTCNRSRRRPRRADSLDSIANIGEFSGTPLLERLEGSPDVETSIAGTALNIAENERWGQLLENLDEHLLPAWKKNLDELDYSELPHRGINQECGVAMAEAVLDFVDHLPDNYDPEDREAKRDFARGLHATINPECFPPHVTSDGSRKRHGRSNEVTREVLRRIGAGQLIGPVFPPDEPRMGRGRSD